MIRAMKAIVLSCDKYQPFALHMVTRYQKLWPNHPFEFLIPYQHEASLDKLQQGRKIQAVKTPSEIRATILSLLDQVDPEEWILWSIDDKYPETINVPALETIIHAIQNLDNRKINGIAFTRCRRWRKSQYLIPGKINLAQYKKFGVLTRKINLIERKDYSQIWLHQFIQTKALRTLIEKFPEITCTPKALDKIKNEIELPKNQHLYVTKRTFATYAESTTRGLVTKNAAESMAKELIDIPECFGVSEKSIFIS